MIEELIAAETGESSGDIQMAMKAQGAQGKKPKKHLIKDKFTRVVVKTSGAAVGLLALASWINMPNAIENDSKYRSFSPSNPTAFQAEMGIASDQMSNNSSNFSVTAGQEIVLPASVATQVFGNPSRPAPSAINSAIGRNSGNKSSNNPGAYGGEVFEASDAKAIGDKFDSQDLVWPNVVKPSGLSKSDFAHILTKTNLSIIKGHEDDFAQVLVDFEAGKLKATPRNAVVLLAMIFNESGGGTITASKVGTRTHVNPNTADGRNQLKALIDQGYTVYSNMLGYGLYNGKDNFFEAHPDLVKSMSFTKADIDNYDKTGYPKFKQFITDALFPDIDKFFSEAKYQDYSKKFDNDELWWWHNAGYKTNIFTSSGRNIPIKNSWSSGQLPKELKDSTPFLYYYNYNDFYMWRNMAKYSEYTKHLRKVKGK